MMADERLADIQDASEEVWRSGDAELFALADWTGKIVALHTLVPGFPREAAEQALAHSPGSSGRRRLVVRRRVIYIRLRCAQFSWAASSSQMYLGTVIVGREIDSRVAAEVGADRAVPGGVSLWR